LLKKKTFNLFFIASSSTETFIGTNWFQHCARCEHFLSSSLGIIGTAFDNDEENDIKGFWYKNGQWPSTSESTVMIPKVVSCWKSNLFVLFFYLAFFNHQV
jgi:hypothetical protein